MKKVLNALMYSLFFASLFNTGLFPCFAERVRRLHVGSTFDSEITVRLDQALQEEFESQQLIGVVAGIWIPGKGIWIQQKGLANIKKNRPMHAMNQFRIGSITKSFTTTVLLQLVDEGLLHLDETIDRFHIDVPNADQITIRQLCNHTSGLYNYTENRVLQETLVENPLKKWKPEELTQVPAIAPPGMQVAYNNTNFIIQQRIIEQLTKMSLHQCIAQRITKPLGLRHTRLPKTYKFSRKFARGYIVESQETIIDFTFIHPSAAGGAGGMISNLLDLKRWVKALATGELLSEELQRERLTFVSPSPIPGPFQGPFIKFGLGIEKLGPFLGHQGDIIAYNGSMNYLPEHDAIFIVLINRNPTQKFPCDEATMIFRKLSKIVFPNDVPW